MIELTQLNGLSFFVNPDFIIAMQELETDSNFSTPARTKISLEDRQQIIVIEKANEIKEKINAIN